MCLCVCVCVDVVVVAAVRSRLQRFASLRWLDGGRARESKGARGGGEGSHTDPIEPLGDLQVQSLGDSVPEARVFLSSRFCLDQAQNPSESRGFVYPEWGG